MAMLKGFCYQPRKLGSTWTWVWIIFYFDILDLQSFFLKITTKFNAQWAMDKPMDLNSSNALLHVHFNEFVKVGKFVVVQIMGFVENKRTFLTLIFMKTRLQNKICEHLDLVVHIYAQPLHTIDNFIKMLPSLLGLMKKPKGIFWLDKIDPSSWIFLFWKYKHFFICNHSLWFCIIICIPWFLSYKWSLDFYYIMFLDMYMFASSIYVAWMVATFSFFSTFIFFV